jgi:hypothetical protein
MQLSRGTVHRAPTFYNQAVLQAQASNHIQPHVIARSPPERTTKQSQAVSVQNAIMIACLQHATKYSGQAAGYRGEDSIKHYRWWGG